MNSHTRSAARQCGRLALIALAMSAASPSLARGQERIVSILDVSALLPVDNDVVAPQPPSTSTATAATSGTTTTTPAGQTTPALTTAPAVPEHTGLRTLARDTVHDYMEFPQRKSTWIILSVGAGLAAAFHPLDDDVNSHLVTSSAADKIWKPGHIIGGPVMYAVPVALYVGGRYFLPSVSDDPQTNKWSHLGLDML